MRIGIIGEVPDLYRRIAAKQRDMPLEILNFRTAGEFFDGGMACVMLVVDHTVLELQGEETIRGLIACCRSAAIEMIIAEDVEGRLLESEFDRRLRAMINRCSDGPAELQARATTEEVFGNGKPIPRLVERQALNEIRAFQDKARLGIIGISDGAGVSLVTLSLAKAISDCGLMPAVIEIGKASFYDAIGIEKRFAGRNYFSFHKAIKDGEKIRNRHNLDEGINWILRSPEDGTLRLSAGNIQRLIGNVAGDVMICDFSGFRIQETNQTFIADILKEMDAVIVLIDPLPSRMIPAYGELRAAGRLFKEAIYVINKHNHGINSRQMMKFLGIRSPILLPLVPQEEFFKAEYCCSIPYGSATVKRMLQGPITAIMKRAIPPEILKF